MFYFDFTRDQNNFGLIFQKWDCKNWLVKLANSFGFNTQHKIVLDLKKKNSNSIFLDSSNFIIKGNLL